MRKTQTILEVTVAFIIGLLFFFGIMAIWLWGDNQIAKRQPPYNQSRVAAGTLKKNSSSSGGGVTLDILLAEKSELETEGKDPKAKDLYWPVYNPDELTEEDVFGLQKQE